MKSCQYQSPAIVNMPKRTHSETLTSTVTPATVAVESPKKLDPLPEEVMKALGIINNYVEKQQAQAQAASDSCVPPRALSSRPIRRGAERHRGDVADLAAISSSGVSQDNPPVCYACKISVISKNVRRRTIDGEKRDMCSFCFSNIYKVLFPSEHNRAYNLTKYEGKPLPPITIPEGCDLVRVMKEASQHSRASANDPSRSPKRPRKFRKFHHRPLTEKLERIILDAYHEHTSRHKWISWTEIGEDALQKYDGFLDRDKRHTSLGETTKKFIEQRL